MIHKHIKKVAKTHKSLAQERTILASERNTLAYIRTGFSSFLLGIGLIKFFENEELFFNFGLGAVLFGFIFILIGIIYYPIRKKKIKSY